MRKKLRRLVAAICAVLGLLLLGSELALRQFPRFLPPQKAIVEDALHTPYRATVADPDVGFLPPPHTRIATRTGDRVDIYQTDGKGFSNSEPWPEHPAIVFLGDSLTVGHDVDVAESFPRVVGDLLSTDVVNLGAAGAGPGRQAAIYRKFGRALGAELVVACAFMASDLQNDEHFLSWVSQGRPGLYDEYRLQLARAFGSSQRPLWARALDKSWLYVYTRDALLPLASRDYISDRRRLPDGTELLLYRPAITFATTAAAADDPLVGSMVRSLEQLRRLVTEDHAALLVVLLPSKEEVFGVPPAAMTGNAVARARERLRDAGFSVLDLYSLFDASRTQPAPYFAIGAHFNAYGNRRVAEALASWIQTNSPVRPRPAGVGASTTGQTPNRP